MLKDIDSLINIINTLKSYTWDKLIHSLTRDRGEVNIGLSNFDRLRYEIRPGDVLLVEGRTRISSIIKTVTQCCWTHSAIYVGRLHDIENPAIRAHIKRFYNGDPEEQLIIEAMIGEGTLVDNLRKYRGENLRICRPKGITHQDAQKVINYAIKRLGSDYDVRQILDLLRFLFPYSILPRRWRSSLFQHHAGATTKTVCSTMMAEAFASVHFPILPVLQYDEDHNLKLYRRNTKLITPSDFDYSPYFDVIKYPIFDFDELSVYKQLPWNSEGVMYNDADKIQVIDGSGNANILKAIRSDITGTTN
ncbi:MAG: YiiX/YebB-like N1pC/P60 family cysteine hydrolase [Gammaproteobacteria bacterium]|nr:YiiX/YebB-like N1pC/P60 family cysteine hydrolase [Gammaproteobacteria bacterium]